MNAHSRLQSQGSMHVPDVAELSDQSPWKLAPRNKIWRNEPSTKGARGATRQRRTELTEWKRRSGEDERMWRHYARARANSVSHKGRGTDCFSVCAGSRDVTTVKHALLRTPLITRHRAQSDPPSEIRPTYALRASASGRPSFAEPCITSARCLTTRGSFPHGRFHPSAKDEST